MGLFSFIKNLFGKAEEVKAPEVLAVAEQPSVLEQVVKVEEAVQEVAEEVKQARKANAEKQAAAKKPAAKQSAPKQPATKQQHVSKQIVKKNK
jgi:hypothetical protein